ncbi:condensation domain-containing protein, partial [Streptomyces sp. NPDC050546]|uniref:condensation domain-containing protein n=1 Tax=Streptomyces sp. NPDC050546 TaxID=3365628 RepID=UPI0037AE9721
PASFGQERLWLLDRLGAGSAYHVAGGLRVSGRLDVAVLERAVGELVARHEVLRTGLVWADGGLRQVVRPAGATRVPVDVVEVTEGEGGVDRWLTPWVEQPFDLAAGPLVRVAVGQLAAAEQVVALAVHHAVVDGWSLGIVLRELGALYAAFAGGAEVSPLPEPELQYGDFATWQRETVTDDSLRSGLDHWTSVLADAAPLELPTDAPRREGLTSYDLGVLPVAVSGGLVGRVRSVAEGEQATVFQGLFASFAALLGRWSGQRDVVLGTPVAGRSRTELEDVVGFFVNTLALRLDTSGPVSFAELTRRARTATLDALAHEDVPFEKVAQAVGAGNGPLVRVLLAVDSTPRTALRLPGVEAAEMAWPGGRAQFELALHLREQPDGSLAGRIEYAADLFEPATVERLRDAWLRLLQHVTDSPERPVAAHPLPGAAELARLEAFSAPDPEAVAGLLHEQIAEQAARTPNAVAVATEDGPALTYAELDARANRLARHLRALGVGTEDVVGLCLHRSPELVIALVGVLKAGAAYLPLDPDYPPARLARMATTSQASLVLLHGPTRSLAKDLELPPDTHLLDLDLDLDLDPDLDLDEAGPAAPTPPVVDLTPDNAAYVLYTSGSTGAPKGAVNTHAAFTNRITWMQNAYHLTADDTVLFKTPIGFDVSGWEWAWPLTTGARIQLAAPGAHRDPARLARLIQDSTTTVCHFVPSMLGFFLADPAAGQCTGLRTVVVSGEALTPHLAASFHATLPHTGLHNLYGPTE